MANKEAVADETVATEEAAAKVSKKDPKPEGMVSPIAYAEHRTELLGKLVRPQTIYSYVRNTEGFPCTRNTDGRYMIDQAAADKWFEDRAAAKAAKQAEKAAKATESKDKEAAAAN